MRFATACDAAAPLRYNVAHGPVSAALMSPPLKPARQRPFKALLLIDLVNTWEMDGGPQLLRRTHALLPQLQRLRAGQTPCAAGA